MYFRSKPLTLGITLALAFPAWAQESESGHTSRIEEVVITSSRVPVPLRQIGTSVTVMTEFDIESRGNLGLTDVLRQMPAIGTSTNGGPGKSTSLRIRGEEGFRTLTIFDGMRLSDPASPQVGPQLEHLLSSGIGRVEVLRGPQGLSYGADAGGVLNISSRRATNGLSGNVDAQTGRYGTQQYSANLGGGNDRADFFASLADFETDGFNTRADDPTGDEDGYSNTTFHGRVGVNLNEQWRAELVHRQTDGDSEVDGCFLNVTIHDCPSTYEMEATRGALEYKSDNFTHSLSYATTETDRENFARDVSTYTAAGELERWEYVGSALNLLPSVDLVFGGDHEVSGFNGGERDNTGVYFEGLSDFSDSLFFTAGVRYDDNEDFGTNTSYRLSGAYLMELANGGTLKFKSSYGTGFRAPSPYEVNYNRSASAYPPASLVNLAQEKSRGVEAGIEYYTEDDAHFEIVFFDQEVKDAIFFDLADFSGYLQDVGKSTSRGVEMNAQFSITQTLVSNINYTYNDTERPNGLPRLRRPEHLLNLGLSWYGMDHKLSVNGYYRMSRDSYDGSGAVMTKLDNFGVLDLSVNYAYSDNLTVYGRVENALDKRYQEIGNYNTAHAAAYVGVRVSFAQ